MLSEQQRKEVYKQISTWAKDREVSNQAEICRDVIICQLARYCGLHDDLTLDQMQTEVEKLGNIFITLGMFVLWPYVRHIASYESPINMLSHHQLIKSPITSSYSPSLIVTQYYRL